MNKKAVLEEQAALTERLGCVPCRGDLKRGLMDLIKRANGDQLVGLFDVVVLLERLHPLKTCGQCAHMRARTPKDKSPESGHKSDRSWCGVLGFPTMPNLLRCGGDDFQVKQEEEMLLTIVTSGDESVGIRPGTVEVRFIGCRPDDWDEETRFATKQTLGPIISDLEDFPLKTAYFQDECPQCGKLKAECKCPEMGE